VRPDRVGYVGWIDVPSTATQFDAEPRPRSIDECSISPHEAHEYHEYSKRLEEQVHTVHVTITSVREPMFVAARRSHSYSGPYYF